MVQIWSKVRGIQPVQKIDLMKETLPLKDKAYIGGKKKRVGQNQSDSSQDYDHSCGQDQILDWVHLRPNNLHGLQNIANLMIINFSVIK